MPRSKAKQYRVIVKAGENVRPAPHTPERVLLFIQNTGANPLQVSFEDEAGEAVDGGDFILTSMAYMKFDNPDTCPSESVNLRSALGTTAAVLEGVRRG